MKKLLGLVFALMIAFTLVGCEEAKTIIEKEIEIVEVERIVIQTVTEKLSDEQLENIETIITAEVVAEHQAQFNSEYEELQTTYDEELAQAIEDLEPVVKWRDKIIEKIEYVDRVEYVYVDKDMGVYSDQDYLDLEIEINELSDLVANKDLEIATLELSLEVAEDGVEFLHEFILEVADGAKVLQVYVGIPEETTYASYQEMFSAIGAEYTVLEDRIVELEAEIEIADGDITALEIELQTALDGIDFLHQFILQVAADAKLLQVHVGIDENTVFLSYEEMFNAIAGAYTTLETERDNLIDEVSDLESQIDALVIERDALELELADLQIDYDNTLLALSVEEDKVNTLETELNALELDIAYLESIVNDSVKPVLGEVTLTNDEFDNLVLTVNASDNIGLKSLEVDHSVITIPEFTLETTDILASEETFGASMVYTEGLWTVNFGEMMSNEIRNNPTITFYFVIKDLANNQFGNMYYVQPEMTVVLDVPEIPVT